jgi:hypothetical protein
MCPERDAGRKPGISGEVALLSKRAKSSVEKSEKARLSKLPAAKKAAARWLSAHRATTLLSNFMPEAASTCLAGHKRLCGRFRI